MKQGYVYMKESHTQYFEVKLNKIQIPNIRPFVGELVFKDFKNAFFETLENGA